MPGSSPSARIAATTRAALALALLLLAGCGDLLSPHAEPRYVQVAAGGFTTCAVLESGSMRCLGGRIPELADPGPLPGEAPRTPFGTGLDWRDVALGPVHICAIDSTRSLYCWGENGEGELATGDFRARPWPTLIRRDGYDRVAAGNVHGCAIDRGRVDCWGVNFGGQAGLGDLPGANVPTPVGVDDAERIDLTGASTCAVTTAAALECWGVTRTFVDAPPKRSRTPVPVFPGLAYTDVSLGFVYGCALAAGRVYCWGPDVEGVLGGSDLEADPPRPVSLPPIVEVEAGGEHTCALDRDGGVWCWGRNVEGQLGTGETSPYGPPGRVEGLPPVARIDLGNSHSCALTTRGAVYCWGYDLLGQIGGGGNSPVPLRMDFGGAAVY